MLKRFLPCLIVLLSILPVSHTRAQGKVTPIRINKVVFVLPGTWQQLPGDNQSRQHGFKEQGTGRTIAIAVSDPGKMEFYNKRMKQAALVEAYYKWDSDYWKNAPGVAVERLGTDTAKHTVLWKIRVRTGENILLFGMKAGRLVSINLNNSDVATRLDDAAAKRFLEKILNS